MLKFHECHIQRNLKSSDSRKGYAFFLNSGNKITISFHAGFHLSNNNK